MANIVYIVSDGVFTKPGFSTDLNTFSQRKKSYESHNPQAKFLKVFEVKRGKYFESMLLEAFSRRKFQRRMDWFKVPKKIVELICGFERLSKHEMAILINALFRENWIYYCRWYQSQPVLIQRFWGSIYLTQIHAL